MRVFRPKGTKNYRVRFSVNRIRHDLALGTEFKEVAEKKARELKKEKEYEAAGLLLPKKIREGAKTPLSELLEKWLSIGLSPDVGSKHRTYSRMRPTKVFQDCRWKFLRDVSPTTFQSWVAISRKEGMKPKTLNEYRSHLFSFFGWLVDHEIISENPLRVVKPLKVPKADSQRAMKPEELEALFAASPWYRRCVYVVASHSGLRRKELRTLTWERLDLESDPATLDLKPERTKNEKGGYLPLLPDVVEALKELKAKSPANRPEVFFRGVTENRRFWKDLQQAGVPLLDSRGRSLVFHSFRRTFATILANSNVSPAVARLMMRHCNISITMDLYADQELLPVVAEMKKVPRLSLSPTASPKIGKTCPNVSTEGKTGNTTEHAGSAENPLYQGDLASSVHLWEKPRMAEREGFEPSVGSPLRSLSKGVL